MIVDWFRCAKSSLQRCLYNVLQHKYNLFLLYRVLKKSTFNNVKVSPLPSWKSLAILNLEAFNDFSLHKLLPTGDWLRMVPSLSVNIRQASVPGKSMRLSPGHFDWKTKKWIGYHILSQRAFTFVSLSSEIPFVQNTNNLELQCSQFQKILEHLFVRIISNQNHLFQQNCTIGYGVHTLKISIFREI